MKTRSKNVAGKGTQYSDRYSNGFSQHSKTPLQQFDVAAFFEEYLDDIIDLEENRSGVEEFEDAVKKN
ncbi:MAG TPA: hypothetical protein DCY20_04335 [Firmicutes bacterium]|nr:hypothetical protein [Bacillota bacterium]